MAKYIPSEEELKYYEDMMRKDPYLKDKVDNWDDLPFPPQWEDPMWYLPTVSREAWGALPAKPGGEPLKAPVMYVRYTWVGQECETVEECSNFMRTLQKTSMDEGLPDIPYNFLIGGKGIIYEGRGWDTEADREQKHNDFEGMYGKLKGKTVDVAYIGDMYFYGPSNDQKMGAVHFVKEGVRNKFIDEMFEIIPYRERPKSYLSSEAYFDLDTIKKYSGNPTPLT